MPRYTSLEYLRYLLFEVHQVQDLFDYEYFAHLDVEQASIIIDAAKALADRDMYPFFKEMDEQPIRYEGNGVVWSHPQLKAIIQNAAEQCWINGSISFEHGGMQMPESLYNAGHHIFQAANNGVQGYISLTTGAARLITTFGNKEQVEIFTPPMFDGRWQGTMALTEPQAGSSLTDITTSATPTDSGHYKIKGHKIFISGGQHLACDNFVHLTLARIAGAPPGVKGISLFIVPKFRPEPDGSLVYNDVFCAGDFQKMGQKAYATTHLAFGDQGDCQGYLVGEPNKGLQYMFQMMNEARIGVGQTATSIAMAAYYASLQYARERQQGRHATEKDPTKPPVHIIEHADVQRMLFTQKAIVEGALSLAMECNKLMDLTHVTSGEERKNHLLLLEILTPIVKTYSSEQANRSVSMGVQILGGYGYTMDFPLQQYYRDMRIMSLYEGTTGIQSLDLLGRKVTMENGQALKLLASKILETCAAASSVPELQSCAADLQKELGRVNDTLQALLPYAQKGELSRYLADATIFMEMASYVVIAWQWLKLGLTATKALETKDFTKQSQVFYESKIHTMSFFFRYELPHAAACAKILHDTKSLTMIDNYELFE